MDEAKGEFKKMDHLCCLLGQNYARWAAGLLGCWTAGLRLLEKLVVIKEKPVRIRPIHLTQKEEEEGGGRLRIAF